MLHFTRKARRMAFGEEEPLRPSSKKLLDDGVSFGDAALLQDLEKLCPAPIALATDFQTEWVLDSGRTEMNSSTDCAIVASSGDWVEINVAGLQVVQSQPSDVVAEARIASVGIQRELQWYFQERDSRLFGFRSNPVERPCARTVFARRLLRYAASSLPAADECLLQAWSAYLRAIVQERPFSSSNMLWPSRFEGCLEACLARLERLLKKVKGNAASELTPCPVEQHVVTRAMARRDMAGTFTAVPVERFVVWRQITKVSGALSNVQTRLPFFLPGLQTVALLNGWAANIIFGTACLELMVQLAAQLRSYTSGEIDGRTLAEDALVASGSAATFALGRYTSSIFAVGEGFAAVMGEQFGPSFAAFLMSILLRSAGQEMNGGTRMRALRNAYASLGLNSKGVLTYSPQEIETQLESRLRRPNRTERNTLRWWAAYAYIREHQHPELKDPWRHVNDIWSGATDINYDKACAILNMNPDSTFTKADLRRRYLQLSLMHHPDRPTGDHQAYLRLHAAYDLLRSFCNE